MNNTMFLTKSHESVGVELTFKLSSEPDLNGSITEVLHVKSGSSTYEIAEEDIKKLCGYSDNIE
jgi:hypothetical protein